ERYTRNGGFTLRADGTVITPGGDPLLGEGGPIQLDGASMEVAADGTVRADDNEIGKLRIVRFKDAGKAEKDGANLFRSNLANVTLAEHARVVQGHLEQSNVGAVDSMVALISINRQFESYQRAMKLLDSITEKILSDNSR
ncbi:MAG: flagellar basal body rod C-terminal domain-containing protein, partial [Candidatus Binatia bacterium]